VGNPSGVTYADLRLLEGGRDRVLYIIRRQLSQQISAPGGLEEGKECGSKKHRSEKDVDLEEPGAESLLPDTISFS